MENLLLSLRECGGIEVKRAKNSSIQLSLSELSVVGFTFTFEQAVHLILPRRALSLIYIGKRYPKLSFDRRMRLYNMRKKQFLVKKILLRRYVFFFLIKLRNERHQLQMILITLYYFYSPFFDKIVKGNPAGCISFYAVTLLIKAQVK